MYEWLRKPVHLPSGLELSSADQVSLGSGAPDYVAFLAKFGAKQLGEVNTRNTKVQVNTQGGYSRLLAVGEARAGSLGDTPRHHSTAEAHLRDDQVNEGHVTPFSTTLREDFTITVKSLQG